MFEKKIRMNNVVLSLGSNMGDRFSNLSKAVDLIREIPSSYLKSSSVYQTTPWGNSDQPDFYNQVVEIESMYDAPTLMERCLEIEMKMGRQRKQKWEPRIIDIDILFFNEDCIASEHLIIPHSHLHERRFVLEPLNEILPNKKHPVFHKSISRLLNELKEEEKIKKLKKVKVE